MAYNEPRLLKEHLPPLLILELLPMVVSEIFDSFKNRLFSFIDTILIIGLI
jgi:hypothetical protein